MCASDDTTKLSSVIVAFELAACVWSLGQSSRTAQYTQLSATARYMRRGWVAWSVRVHCSVTAVFGRTKLHFSASDIFLPIDVLCG